MTNQTGDQWQAFALDQMRRKPIRKTMAEKD